MAILAYFMSTSKNYRLLHNIIIISLLYALRCIKNVFVLYKHLPKAYFMFALWVK